MAKGRYQFGPGSYQPGQLQDEIVAASLTVPLEDVLAWGYPAPGGFATAGIAVFSEGLPPADEAKLLTVFTSHIPIAGYISLVDLAKLKGTAKDHLTLNEPIWIAVRNALRIAFGAISQNRQALIALLNDYNNRFGTALQVPPAPRSWQQLLIAVQQQIDSEVNPSG